MSELVAVQSPRSPILAGIRRAESMTLAVMAVAAVISFGPAGAPLSFALLGVAAVLLPRRREVEDASRDEQCLQLARELLSEGWAIRSRYHRSRELQDVRIGNRALLENRFEMLAWISNGRARLARYPEFATIYDAHHGNDLLEEFDGRLHRLEEIQRLVQASRRLNLPI